jgi:hypothetical protein
MTFANRALGVPGMSAASRLAKMVLSRAAFVVTLMSP